MSLQPDPYPPQSVSPSAPIGVFDSGVGGLSVLRAIRHELPEEDLLYVADSGNAPYGDRSASFIQERVAVISRFLLASGSKAIVIACNTATVVAVAGLRAWCPVPVVAMEPAIKPAARGTKSGVVGVLATTQTLKSPSVARLCEAYGGGVRILLQPCPGLVEQVERSELASDETRALLSGYLKPLLAAGADTIVLGCTHYAFLRQAVADIIGPRVSIVDPAIAVAHELRRRIAGNLHVRSGRDASEVFYSTAPQRQAGEVMSALWGRPVAVHSLSAP